MDQNQPEDLIVKHVTQTLPTLLLCLAALTPLSSKAQEPARIIEIHARRFAFSPSEITLKPGEAVKLRLVSDDVTHSLVVPGLRIKQEVSKGHPVDITVAPDSVGDFRGECGRFCGSGHGSMLFVIHVKE